MSFSVATGNSYREYTVRHVGQSWVTSALKTVFIILPVLVYGVPFGSLHWPFAATAAVAVLLTLYSMRGPYTHDRVLKVDKTEGTLTAVEKRSGGREQLTRQVSLVDILAVGTCCRSYTVYKRGGESSFTAYRYAPVFLLKNGELIETLAPVEEAIGQTLQGANKETMELATFLEVSGVTVGERQTVKVCPGPGSDNFELRVGRLPLASIFRLSAVQIPLLVVFMIATFAGFATLENARREFVGDTKKARINKMLSNAPRPKAPVDNSKEGVLRRGVYSEVRKLVESEDFAVNDLLEDGLTPLQVVCEEDLNPETAWVLLRSGASQKVVNDQGQAPGDYLVQRFLESPSKMGANQCLTLAVLIEDGYKVPLNKDEFGMTPLHHFVRDSRMDSAVEAMVEVQGVDVNLRDDYGWTVLHHAVEARDDDLKLALIRLLKLGADKGARSKKTSGPALHRSGDKAVEDFALPANSTALDLSALATGDSQVSGRQLLE